MNVLDHTQDVSGQETHRLLSLYPAPDFVKNAAHERLHGDSGTMARHLYAEPHKKLYPCHSAPATWMSALWFAEKQSSFESKTAAAVEDKIRASATYFGIGGLVDELMRKVAIDANTALSRLPDSDFAIVWRTDDGTAERHWPLRNATEVKFAAAHFNKYRDEFVFLDRHKIANKILAKAEEYSADVNDAADSLYKAAGRGLCATKVAAELLRQRAVLGRKTNAALSGELEKLAGLIERNPTETQTLECRIKLASVVDQYDRETKLFRLYDAGGLPRAEEVLFAINEKVANDFMSGHVETVTGNVYALDDLEKIAVDDLRAWLGDEFADAVSAGGVYTDRDKLAAIVPTLDRGMATTLDRLVREKGASAVVRGPEHEALLPAERLYEMAAQPEV
jgi:hypothetical protein